MVLTRNPSPSQESAITQLPQLRINATNPHQLATTDGTPFFLLGDTAWELFHRLTLAESDFYFANRAAKGFNLICAVALAEFDGLRTPNAAGELPLHDRNPRRPNEAYFATVDAQIRQAEAHGLYVGLLPIWGDKLTAPWGDGPRIFDVADTETARAYGLYLGQRYCDTTNLLWILGGDRPARRGESDWTPIWRAMAAGITEGTHGEALFAYHPQGGKDSTSVHLHDESWLHINMMQSGHGGGHDVPVWEWISRDYNLTPIKPTLDAEPNYEDHPVNPWPTWDPANGYFRDADVRRQCYRSVFAGGCGVIYGHHAIWQFWDESRPVINHADRYWREAIDRPGAFQVGYLRRLMEAWSFENCRPDPAMIASDAGEGASHVAALREASGRHALLYIPPGRTLPLAVRVERLAGPNAAAVWFDPVRGQEFGTADVREATGIVEFETPNAEQDWVLTLKSM